MRQSLTWAAALLPSSKQCALAPPLIIEIQASSDTALARVKSAKTDDTTPTKGQRRKRAESFYFERAQGLVTCWPTGTIDATGEEPDILVEGPGVRYGVEVTEMLRGNVRAVEESRRLICEKAQKLFLRSVDADCLDVKAIFREHVALSLKDQDAAATNLAAIVGCRIGSIPSGVLSVIQ